MRVLVVGGGLAGATVSFALRARGLEVEGWWNGEPGASDVAAGMFNPVSFRRVVETWDAAEHLAVALRFYRAMEAATGGRFLHEDVPVLRVFPSASYRELWEERCGDGAGVGRWISVAHPVPDGVVAPHGAGWVRGSGWLDVPALLTAWRGLAPEHGGMRWVLRRWEASEGVPAEFDALVDARGVGARQDLQGLGIPLNINQGEVLTLGPGVWNEPWGLNRVHWLLPVEGGRSRLGATYRWDLEENRVHPEVAQSLLAAVEGVRLEPFPPGAVEEHVSGLRPVAPDRRPILGLVGDKHWIFNGLGTRGVMVAPRAAEFLAGQIHSNSADPTPPYASPFRWRDRGFKRD